jgi:hypothetical protein
MGDGGSVNFRSVKFLHPGLVPGSIKPLAFASGILFVARLPVEPGTRPG